MKTPSKAPISAEKKIFSISYEKLIFYTLGAGAVLLGQFKNEIQSEKRFNAIENKNERQDEAIEFLKTYTYNGKH